jgi:hypothetical protein
LAQPLDIFPATGHAVMLAGKNFCGKMWRRYVHFKNKFLILQTAFINNAFVQYLLQFAAA